MSLMAKPNFAKNKTKPKQNLLFLRCRAFRRCVGQHLPIAHFQKCLDEVWDTTFKYCSVHPLPLLTAWKLDTCIGTCLSPCLPPRPPGAMSRATGVLIINTYFPLHHPHQAPVQDSSVPGCCDEGSPNPGDCCCGMWSGIGRALGGSESLWLESHFQPQRDVSQKDVHPPYLRTWKLPHSEAFAKDFDHGGSRFWGEKGKHLVEVGGDGLWGGTEVNGHM